MQLKVATFDIDQALQNDANQPALCFTFTWSGLTEQVELECNEPVTGGVPALFVGETFARIARNQGSIFRREGSKAIVRRAALDEEPLGKHTLYFLAQPYPGENPILLHIKTAPPAHYKKFRHQMWVGIRTNAVIKLVHKCEQPEKQEYLLSLRDKETVDVFFADGRVVRVERAGDKLLEKRMSVEWQAAQRVGYAHKLIKGNDRGLQTFAYFQLIGVMDMAGAKSQRVFNALYAVLRDTAKKLMLDKRVLERFLDVLKRRDPDRAMKLDKELLKAKLSCLGKVT